MKGFIENINSLKQIVGGMDGWMDGWFVGQMGGWWMDG